MERRTASARPMEHQISCITALLSTAQCETGQDPMRLICADEACREIDEHVRFCDSSIGQAPDPQAFLVVGVCFILSWNEFLFALILTGKSTNTLPVGLAGFQTQRGVDIALLSAATMVSIVPVLVLLPFMRRYLIKGISLGALK